jgi:hypothetical protein
MPINNLGLRNLKKSSLEQVPDRMILKWILIKYLERECTKLMWSFKSCSVECSVFFLAVIEVSKGHSAFIFNASEFMCVKVGFSGRAVWAHRVPFTMENLFISWGTINPNSVYFGRDHEMTVPEERPTSRSWQMVTQPHELSVGVCRDSDWHCH